MRKREGEEGSRGAKERKRRKAAEEKSARGNGERDSGVGHPARVFRSIPPFRLALRSVPVDTPRTPYFLPFGFARY